MKKLMIVIALACLVLPQRIGAEMNTSLKIIGFSADGRYLAYEISGYDTISQKAFSLMQIVDVLKNDFATDDFLTEIDNGKEKLQTGSLREASYRKAQAAIQRYKIVEGNEGTLIYKQFRLTAIRDVTFSLSQGGEQPYRITLSPRSVESSSCDHLSDEGRTPKIFTLTLHREERSKILQKDSVLYRSRHCPYDYGIYRIYALENNLAVFLHSFTAGANVYKLVVTGTLDFPKIYLRAAPEPQERIAEYRYKGNEKTLDSGRISVQFVSDSSTYDREHNSDSYRKLVIIDKRQAEPVVQALVLPPGVFFDYPYYLHDVYDGEKKLILITGKNSFYIYDFLQNALSAAVSPGKGKPGEGQDARSGNLVRCKISADGTKLSGAVVHSGSFVYDISDPMSPQEVEYKVDFNTQD